MEVQHINHSLRATSTIQMFSSGIQEKVIVENSGHRSTKQQPVAMRVTNSPRCNPHTTACKPVKKPERHLLCLILPLFLPTEIPSERKPAVSASNEPFAHSLGRFSGNFINCKINISLKRHCHVSWCKQCIIVSPWHIWAYK